MFFTQYIPLVQELFAFISEGKESPKLDYSPSTTVEQYKQDLLLNRHKDLILQRTTIGIHKDDLEIGLMGLPFKQMASQGQRKSMLFALKLAEFEYLKHHFGFEPILLLDDVFEKLDQQDLSKVKMMWVSYPHMPTGATGSLNLFKRIVAFAKKHHILVINDNPYSFVLNENPISILQVDGAKEVALELNSLSKTYNMAGWRVGMVSGKSDYIEAILRVKSNMDSGMFYGIQKGAIEALKLEKTWFKEQNVIYQKRRKLTFELAKKLGCTYDENSVGLFVWAKLPQEILSAEDFVDKILYKKDIFITPGTVFGSNGEGFIRFSLCVKEEKIKEAILRF